MHRLSFTKTYQQDLSFKSSKNVLVQSDRDDVLPIDLLSSALLARWASSTPCELDFKRLTSTMALESFADTESKFEIIFVLSSKIEVITRVVLSTLQWSFFVRLA